MIVHDKKFEKEAFHVFVGLLAAFSAFAGMILYLGQ